MPACGLQAGQPWADQQNPSKQVRVPANIPNRDRQIRRAPATKNL